MDGVIADFTKELLYRYNKQTNEGVKITDLKSNHTGQYVNNKLLLQSIKDTPGFIRSLEPIDGAIRSINELYRMGHDICFVSNGTNCPSSGHEKREWLKQYFGNLWKKAPLVLTHQKYRVRGDVLLEDDPKNLKKLYPETKGLLFDQPYNAYAKGYTRIKDWDAMVGWVNEQTSRT